MRKKPDFDDMSEAYESAFKSKVCYDEVLGNIVVTDPKTGKEYEMPDLEHRNTEVFMARVKRSKAVGRNLFFEEWPEARDVEQILATDNGCLY